ncbi:MAG: serine hydrolase, partial [Bacillota bacterium]|nr:serine hydrolase [Bacillota bacterium]
MHELTRRLNELCDAQPFKTYWYLKDLRTGRSADRGGHAEVTSASTRKISIMMATLAEIAKGKLSLDDPFLIEEKYQHNQSGCFYLLRPGFTITLYDAIMMMIIVSDNTCTGKIVDLVGIDQVNEFCRSIGMTGTAHRFNVPPTATTPLDHPLEASNSTTAADVGHLLEMVVAGAKDAAAAKKLGITPELCQLALKITLQQKLGQLKDQLPPEG